MQGPWRWGGHSQDSGWSLVPTALQTGMVGRGQLSGQEGTPETQHLAGHSLPLPGAKARGDRGTWSDHGLRRAGPPGCSRWRWCWWEPLTSGLTVCPVNCSPGAVGASLCRGKVGPCGPQRHSTGARSRAHLGELVRPSPLASCRSVLTQGCVTCGPRSAAWPAALACCP